MWEYFSSDWPDRCPSALTRRVIVQHTLKSNLDLLLTAMQEGDDCVHRLDLPIADELVQMCVTALEGCAALLGLDAVVPLSPLPAKAFSPERRKLIKDWLLRGVCLFGDRQVNDPMYDVPTVYLTAKEREILALLTAGLKYADIAQHLVISEKTVKKHCGNLRKKLAASTRQEIVANARAYGFTPPRYTIKYSQIYSLKGWTLAEWSRYTR